MKKVFIICALLLFASAIHASHVVNCKCGNDPGGNCIPCEKVDEDTPASKDPENSGQKFCECGYDAGGNCLTCEEAEENEDD